MLIFVLPLKLLTMDRRTFLTASVAAATVLGTGCRGKNELPRREYKNGIKLSVIGFGGIVVVGMEQKDANYTVAEAWDAGVNYFDVAPSYWDGEAETKLGEALKPYRKKAFLACKTTMRDAEGAAREMEQSMKRLQTDYFDLYQLHAVTTVEDVEKIFSPQGAMETFLKAKQQGKIRHIGFSAHSVEAALALLDRYPFDSILFPLNFVCIAQGNFGQQVIEKAREKGAARLALKAMAHHPWPDDMKLEDRPYKKCWYQPTDQKDLAEKALRFTLSLPVTAAIPPGEERLFRLAISIASEFKPMTEKEQQEFLSSTKGITPLFHYPARA